jgi:hypothetical protein
MKFSCRLRFPDVLNSTGKAVGFFKGISKELMGVLLGESMCNGDFAIWFI